LKAINSEISSLFPYLQKERVTALAHHAL